MSIIILCNTASNQSQLNDNTKTLMGEPVQITFSHHPIMNPIPSLRLFRGPYAPSSRCTRITAYTDTSKGIIESAFTLRSDIDGNVCVLRTNYNHSDSAMLDGEPVHFYNLLKTRKETRRGGHHLSDSLYHFHHWLVSEISDVLHRDGYFSSLHGPAEIQSLNLDSLPKTRKEFEK
jgi:hypothetical protein